jgi:hypothetical protein
MRWDIPTVLFPIDVKLLNALNTKCKELLRPRNDDLHLIIFDDYGAFYFGRVGDKLDLFSPNS